MHQPKTISERFWSHVNKSDGCWTWTPTKAKNPRYPTFNAGGKSSIAAHRFSWLLHNGPITNSLMVLHDCDNKRCVRPDHLHLGTGQQNIREAYDRGLVGRTTATHCKWGHEFDLLNTHIDPKNGSRICRKCKARRKREHFARKRLNAHLERESEAKAKR